MVIGHSLILNFLQNSLAKKRLAHAYLFSGPANVGKRTVALEFIKKLTDFEEDKIHPDVLIIEPKIEEKKETVKELNIGIEQIRQVRSQISLSPHQAAYKVVLIDQAEKMSSQAANALLKTLEEPVGAAVIILTTSAPQALLSTIVSRCQMIKFKLVDLKIIAKALAGQSKVSQPVLKKIISLSAGRPGLAISYLESPQLLQAQGQILSDLQKLIGADLNDRYKYIETLSKDIVKAKQVLSDWQLWFRDLVLIALGRKELVVNSEAVNFKNNYSLNKLKNILKSIKRTDYLLSNTSINSRLALEVLMLDF